MTPDRIPPQAIEAEKAVIGTLLAYPDTLDNIISVLTPDMFYQADLSEVFRVCLDITRQGRKFDVITVSNELQKKGLQKLTYLVELSERIVSNQMIEIHALLVKEKYLLRKYIQVGNELANMAYSEDLADVSEKAEMDLLNISGFLQRKEPKKLGDLIDGVINTIERIQNKEIALVGVPSGFTRLDRVTGGFKRGELTIIAGRPSMGKTALALQIAKNAAELKNPVALFSCEMSEDELARRFLSGVSGRSNIDLTSGRCEIDNLLTTSEPLLSLPVYIDDTSSISLLELKAKARKMILKFGIRLAIVDYLQLMTGSGQNREQEISNLSRGLKAIAKDLNIPIIALSQLNRQAEMRRDKKPQLSDLRDSGAIEQDADICMLIFRPAYYNLGTSEIDGADVSSQNLMIINLAKNRNGATGELPLTHNESMTKITE